MLAPEITAPEQYTNYQVQLFETTLRPMLDALVDNLPAFSSSKVNGEVDRTANLADTDFSKRWLFINSICDSIEAVYGIVVFRRETTKAIDPGLRLHNEMYGYDHYDSHFDMANAEDQLRLFMCDNDFELYTYVEIPGVVTLDNYKNYFDCSE